MGQQHFDFVVVGAGSAGAVLAARLSEDPACKVALIEAGGPPPAAEVMPIACPALQLSPETNWGYTADAGKAGRGTIDGRMMVPRGKMLGGSSGLNYMAYVRGHPGDFDAWAQRGAAGWSYAEVLPYFKKSEGLVASDEIAIDADAHNAHGPLGVSLRQPVLTGPREFVAAAVAAGIPRGDYNGSDRRNPGGVASLFQTTTRDGKRSSTYQAFLAGDVSARPNLAIITGAHVTRVLLERTASEPVATGVEYRTADGVTRAAFAAKEVVLSAGAVGSPQLLLLTGIGPQHELERVGVACVVDSPHVGKHLKDHLQTALFFEAPGAGVSMLDAALSMGPDALRAPAGPLPADPADDAALPAQLQGLKQEAERRLMAWATSGSGIASSSLYDASVWFSTGLGDLHTHDAQIAFFCCGYNAELWKDCLRVDVESYFDSAAKRLAPTAESMLVLANPVQPHSEGQIVLASSDPEQAPLISMNYFDDPHDMTVMIAIIRRAFEIVAHWPSHRSIGPWLVPPALATKHGHVSGATPSDALLEDLALHYALTVYHLTSTCRIGDVVDARLRVHGVQRLRVADASVMPNVVSGNTNAAAIMIGEKAAELLARDHAVQLHEFVGP